jgi:hypothetical protein
MAKCQTSVFILFLALGIALTINRVPVVAGPLDESLHIADSLFAAERFTQSYEIYSEIFGTGRKYSPAMLLRMAFIQEGLGNYDRALYYLDLHYRRTYNTLTLQKMEELARQRNLSGYAYSDTQFFLTLYNKYRRQVHLILLSALFLMLSTLFWYRRTRGSRPIGGIIVFILLSGLLMYLNNTAGQIPQAIIREPKTPLMNGPSAGAGVIEIAGRGHRIDVIGKTDVWVKIRWQDGVAWVRENNIEMIRP